MADRAHAAERPVGLRRLTATPTACARWSTVRTLDGPPIRFAAGPQRHAQARWAPSFNRNANGVRAGPRFGPWTARRFVLLPAVGAHARPVGLRRLTATPTACALVHGSDLGRPADSFCCRPSAHGAARWAPSFNRNANGMPALVHGSDLGRPADSFCCRPSATARGPLGSAFNRNANGVRAGPRFGPWTACRFVLLPAVGTHSTGPLGLRLNGSANGVRRAGPRFGPWTACRFVLLPAVGARRGPLGSVV